jgi:hypothetical protein
VTNIDPPGLMRVDLGLITQHRKIVTKSENYTEGRRADNYNSDNDILPFIVQGGAEKRENLKLTMRFRPAVKFLLHVGS